ncbi:MAG: hypothetical protein FWC26_06475 [Fibromonadales bacterium]|nr:hypothetical protein [Fibromonadales bacterium]
MRKRMFAVIMFLFSTVSSWGQLTATESNFHDLVESYRTSVNDVIIEVDESFMADFVEIPEPKTPGITLTIKSANPSNPVTLTDDCNGLFYVMPGAKLILKDIIIEGNSSYSCSGLVFINGGELVLEDGAIIRDSGGRLSLGAQGWRGASTVTMNGGKVIGRVFIYYDSFFNMYGGVMIGALQLDGQLDIEEGIVIDWDGQAPAGYIGGTNIDLEIINGATSVEWRRKNDKNGIFYIYQTTGTDSAFVEINGVTVMMQGSPEYGFYEEIQDYEEATNDMTITLNDDIEFGVFVDIPEPLVSNVTLTIKSGNPEPVTIACGKSGGFNVLDGVNLILENIILKECEIHVDYAGSLTLDGGVVLGGYINGDYYKNNDALKIAWYGSTGYTYGERTANDLYSDSYGAKIAWAIQNSKNGISYSYGTNKGFIEVAGVTVTELENKWFYEQIAAYETANDDVVIEVSESFTLFPVEIPANANGKTLTIKSADPGNPVGITSYDCSDDLFYVSNGANLILENITIWGSSNGFCYSVKIDGEFTMNGGKIDGHIKIENNGTFNMTDGEIIGYGFHNEGILNMTGGILVGKSWDIRNSNNTISGGVAVSWWHDGNTSTGYLAGTSTGLVTIDSSNISATWEKEYDNPGISYMDSGVEVFIPINGLKVITSGDEEYGFLQQIASYETAMDSVIINLDQDLALPVSVNIPTPSNPSIVLIIRSVSDAVSITNANFTIHSGAKLVFENIVVEGKIYVNYGATLETNNDAAIVIRRNSNNVVYVDGIFTMNGGVVIGIDSEIEEIVYGSYTINDGAIIALDNSVSGLQYLEGTSDYIKIAPSGATAVWALNGGKSGISYTTTSSTKGFVEVTDIVVTELENKMFYELIEAHANASDDEIIDVDGSFNLVKNITIPAPVTAGKTLTIRANSVNPVVLTRKTYGVLFTVSDGATLILENIIIDGDRYNNPYNNGSNGSLVVVNEGGTLEMNGGAIERNNAKNNGPCGNYSGGGVLVRGTFIMNGGRIHGNYAGSAGGVLVGDNGTFTMNGGEISGNSAYPSCYAWATTSDHGVAIVEDGIFNLNGGVVVNRGTDISDVISGSYNINGGFAIAYGYNSAYAEDSNTDIITDPSTATAVWANQNSKNGISYVNGLDTGFVEVDGVIVKGVATDNADIALAKQILEGTDFDSALNVNTKQGAKKYIENFIGGDIEEDTDYNGTCLYKGQPIFCEWDGSCWETSTRWSEPSGESCLYHVQNCLNYGQLFIGVTNGGQDVTCISGNGVRLYQQDVSFGIAAFAATGVSFEIVNDAVSNNNYTFKVKLSKGVGTEQVTENLTLVIAEGEPEPEPIEIAVIWSDTVLTYNGSVQCPTATASGYDLEITDCGTNAGTYIATAQLLTPNENVTLTNNTKSYTINKKQLLANMVVSEIQPQIYTGQSITPTVILINGTDTLKAGIDYTVNYADNINASSSAKVKITGIGNYVTTTDIEVLFVIAAGEPEPIQVAVTWSQDSVFTYNGSVQCPTATAGGYDLEVTGCGTNAGTHTATALPLPLTSNVTLQNNMKQYKINPKQLLANMVVSEIQPQIYTGQSITPTVILTNGTDTLKVGVDYTVNYADNINASSSAKVKITGIGNYATTTDIEIPFTIYEEPVTPDNAYNFYFLSPSHIPEWTLGTPYLVWIENGTLKKEALVPDSRCGWYKKTWSNGTQPPNGIALIWLNDPTNDQLGLLGLEEDPMDWIDGSPIPFNLLGKFNEVVGGTGNLFFIPAKSDPIWSQTDQGKIGVCSPTGEPIRNSFAVQGHSTQPDGLKVCIYDNDFIEIKCGLEMSNIVDYYMLNRKGDQFNLNPDNPSCSKNGDDLVCYGGITLIDYYKSPEGTVSGVRTIAPYSGLLGTYRVYAKIKASEEANYPNATPIHVAMFTAAPIPTPEPVPFIAIKDIQVNIPESATLNQDSIQLGNARISPINATNKEITWTVSGGATLNDGIVNFNSSGTATITANIQCGLSNGIPCVDYTKSWNVNVQEALPQTASVDSIMNFFPRFVAKGDSILLGSERVMPANATNRNIVWTVDNALLSGNTIIFNESGMATITGTVGSFVQKWEVYVSVPMTYTLIDRTKSEPDTAYYVADAYVTILADLTNTGKQFSRWRITSKNKIVTLDDVNPYSPILEFSMPEKDLEVKAIYETLYEIMLSGGLGEGYYSENANVTIRPNPNDIPEGYGFSYWDVFPIDAVDVENHNKGTLSFKMPKQDIMLRAVFSVIERDLEKGEILELANIMANAEDWEKTIVGESEIYLETNSDSSITITAKVLENGFVSIETDVSPNASKSDSIMIVYSAIGEWRLYLDIPDISYAEGYFVVLKQENENPAPQSAPPVMESFSYSMFSAPLPAPDIDNASAITRSFSITDFKNEFGEPVAPEAAVRTTGIIFTPASTGESVLNIATLNVVTVSEDPAKTACDKAGNIWALGQCKTQEQINKEQCELVEGNKWENGTCKTPVQIAQESCSANGNVWVSGVCKTPEANACELISGNKWIDGICKTATQILCDDMGNIWSGGKCKTPTENLCLSVEGNVWTQDGECKSQLQVACEDGGDIWSGGQCKAKQQITCEDGGNIWTLGQCKSPLQIVCEDSGDIWAGGVCKTLTQIAKEDCEAAENVWTEEGVCKTPEEVPVTPQIAANNIGVYVRGNAIVFENLPHGAKTGIYNSGGKQMASGNLPSGIYIVRIRAPGVNISKVIGVK